LNKEKGFAPGKSREALLKRAGRGRLEPSEKVARGRKGLTEKKKKPLQHSKRKAHTGAR